MNAVLFDQISKALSTSGTRRGLLRFLAVPPLAGPLAVLRPEESRGKKAQVQALRDEIGLQGQPTL
jgi:hypothetical protein